MITIFKSFIITFLISYSYAYSHSIEDKGSEHYHNSGIFLTGTDSSNASPDGPYVFYKGDSIYVRSVAFNGSDLAIEEDIYSDKTNVILTCNVDDRNLFHFKLMETYVIQPSEYPFPEKILAVSDIEGNFTAFRLILEGSGVIDKDYNWTFGKGHLVLVGDFFDRGLNVTETLWLIYKLEMEAEKAGGKVHFILGNHEIMNLYGDTRYVRNKYIENAAILDVAYIDLFNEDTETGRWLRTKNVAEKIGDILFVHGGISIDLAKSGLTLDQINQTARENIGIKTSLIDSETGKVINSSKTGPFWYRGLVRGEVSDEEMEQILNYANAKKIVVGHTLVEEITPFYKNSLVAIDLDHNEDLVQNKLYALWIENGEYFVIDNFGEKKKLFD
ncbi:MAG TPA: metallophosphoesterase [Ignavibacteria bacterium]|nr:metallophosphoesterase [Ignavibacteria bacterium]HMR42046.1 metallophosphoesterase [Ignavibacteria bacterium]